MISTDTIATPVGDVSALPAEKAPAGADALEHMQLREGEFWRSIPAYKDVDEATFLDHIWQGKHSVKTPEELVAAIQDFVPASYIEDVRTAIGAR